jgi:hypothetical protein
MNTRRFYGIAEIAETLGIDRQLVTAWRRRSSHGMPPPDEELSSGPLWTAATIEPWISATRARLGAGDRAPDPLLVRQAVRRLFRLVAILLEEAPRQELLKRALSDLRQCQEALTGRGAPEFAAMTRAAEELAAAPEAVDRQRELLGECLRAVPHAIRLVS